MCGGSVVYNNKLQFNISSFISLWIKRYFPKKEKLQQAEKQTASSMVYKIILIDFAHKSGLYFPSVGWKIASIKPLHKIVTLFAVLQ